MLPLIFDAQEAGALPHPCTLVLFDRHHDSLPVAQAQALAALLKSGITYSSLIQACDTLLRQLDDDWITAGMELGLIGDAVIFGTEDYDLDQYRTYTDLAGTVHSTHFLWLPSTELGFQGALSDLSKPELKPLWMALGWEARGQTGARFVDGRPPIALDFDLDCFAVKWRDYEFPWPHEVWSAEFELVSTYHTTNGWSGKAFVEGLVNKAGLVTFATEPSCCGGDGHSESIWQALNSVLFDQHLELGTAGAAL